VALIIYLTTTPHGSTIPLTGIVTGNDVIVSPQVAGRMIQLSVDEGSEVHKGDLIAELDPAELMATRDSAAANIRALQAKVTLRAKHAKLDGRSNRGFPTPGGGDSNRNPRAAGAGPGQPVA